MHTWDTTNKSSEVGDFSACTGWGSVGEDRYVLNVLRKCIEYPELKRAVCDQCEAFDASVVPIEAMASATQLIQELVGIGQHAITRYRSQADKMMRTPAQSPSRARRNRQPRGSLARCRGDWRSV